MSRKRPPEINDLLGALREFGHRAIKRPAGDGWWTVNEIAQREGTTPVAVRYRIKCAQRRGVPIQTATGSVLDEEGVAKRTTYYRLGNKGKL